MRVIFNDELNGIELLFDQKPAADVLQAVKDAGFRWHKVKKIWYAKNTTARASFAEGLQNAEPLSVATPAQAPAVVMDDQKALKARYMDEIQQVWKTPDMIKYFDKECGYIVQLADNDLYCIDRPRIETSFCFGYGQNGVSTEEDYRGAAHMANYANTHECYFIRQNLKDIDSMITDLQDASLKWFKFLHYTGQKPGSALKEIRSTHYCNDPEYNPGAWSSLQELQELTADERAALVAGYQAVKQAFIKRLNTYLKRYGLSKLHTWTYLVD